MPACDTCEYYHVQNCNGCVKYWCRARVRQGGEYYQDMYADARKYNQNGECLRWRRLNTTLWGCVKRFFSIKFDTKL